MRDLSFRILWTDRPDTPVNVQVWVKHFYCGIGRFCRDEREAYVFISDYIRRYEDGRRAEGKTKKRLPNI